MIVRKLTTWQEWLEADRITSIAFMHKFDYEKAKKKYMDQAEGKQERTEEAWAGFTEEGVMTSSAVVYHHRQILDGHTVNCGEINMVGTLPEAREGGNINKMMKTIFTDLIERGFVFSYLHPFSFSFYRQFGFELCSSPMRQVVPVNELKNYSCKYKVKMVTSQGDLEEIRELYKSFIQDKNLAFVRPDRDWVLHENGEFGPSDFFSSNSKYSYMFYDELGKIRGYLKFNFEPSKESFTIGTLNVRDIVYDSPDALHHIFGFIYKMRAKCEHLSIHLPDGIDLALLVPNSDKVVRTLSSHSMLRILDVKKALRLMRHPEDQGSYVLQVRDDFLEENSGCYKVNYAYGKVERVEVLAHAEADLTVTEQTLTQMVIGLINLDTATYRLGTKLHSNHETLAKVFVKKCIL